MANNNKFRKNRFLALLLSALMVSSTAIALGACTKKNNNDTSDSDSGSDNNASANIDLDLAIKNGGFETFDTNDGLTVIGESVTGWTRALNSTASGQAPSSKAGSGIVDFSNWKDLTGSHFDNPDDVKTLSQSKAIELWDKLTTRDKLAYYEAWKSANSKGKISTDFEKYESFNIELVDVPEDLADFDAKTHDGKGLGYESTDKDEVVKSNVLMIHNENPKDGSTSTYKALGTAQKFTSSTTVTVPAGASAELSVWVRTANLMATSTSGEPQSAVGKGAYIQVTHSVGGTSLPAYEVKNINTENMSLATTNGWAQYTFYLRGSTYTDSTFSMVLGLGQGGGTDRLDYVNGYAFFDDIQCEIIDNTEYQSRIDEVDQSKLYGYNKTEKKATVTFASEKEDKTINAYRQKAYDTFVMDFHGAFEEVPVFDTSALSFDYTKSEKDGYTSAKDQNPAPFMNGGFYTGDDVTAMFNSLADLKAGTASNGTSYANNKYFQAVVEKYFKDVEYPANGKILTLYSAQGTAYTATSSYPFKFVENPNKQANENYVYTDYLAVSFFVRTSDLDGAKGAGITLVNGEDETSFVSLDTTDITPVKIGKDEDVYDGWQQCFFFVKNDTDNKDATFTLKFNLGPTEITRDTTKADGFKAGAMASFADIQVYPMSKQEYESVSANTYAQLVTLSAPEEDKATGNSGFDSAMAVPSNALEKGLANPKNYKGVYNDSYYVNPPQSTVSEDAYYTSINQYANAGLISREYFTAEDGYYNTATGAWMNGIKSVATANGADTTKANEVWKSVFGNATQPLFIWNDGSNNGKAYGFIGKETTISANTYTAISIKVKVSANATAQIALTDMADTKYGALAFNTNRTYWYDDNGNVLTGDPAEKKTTEIAFKLGKDGLYTPNEKWSGYANLTAEQKSAKYANFAGYSKDSDGNLVVGENGASHAYSDYWNNEGEDGIAFYCKDGKYYADRAKTVLVTSLSDISSLTPRYLNTNNEFNVVVEDTKGEWATVTFYIHTADEAKTYRLEVWSGSRSRNGDGNPANSYVIFDTNNPGTAETNWTNLMGQYGEKDNDYQDGDGKIVSKIESVFSYFDSHNYLRYNEALDENKVGNVYKDSYLASKQEKGVAWLFINGVDEEGNENGDITVLADYKYTETKVNPTVEDDTDTDNDTPDEDTSNSNKDSDINPWPLASSISVAGVLVLAITSIVIQKIVKKVRKNRR